jgi:hypothetical protein
MQGGIHARVYAVSMVALAAMLASPQAHAQGRQPPATSTAADASLLAQAMGNDEAPAPANPYNLYTYDSEVTYAPPRKGKDRTPVKAVRSGGATYGADYAQSDAWQQGGSGGDMPQVDAARGGVRPGRLGVFDQGANGGRKLTIKPFIEAAQVAQYTLTPGHDFVTYSVLAAGVNASLNGRNNQGTVSLRYERRYEWTRRSHGDGLTGIARMSSALAGDTLRIDYGGYANRSYVTASGASVGATGGSMDALTQVYSVYAGPTLRQQVGAVAMQADYHAGYTSVGNSVTSRGASSTSLSDRLDHSTMQQARVAASTEAGDALPVGLGVEAGLYQEDISNLTQRISDKHVRAEVKIPVADNLLAVGGVGYEAVRISARDAQRDASGNALRDANGRLLTDYSRPRQIAFDTSGLIWDAGVIWRPGPRTKMEAHVGRRYGQLGGYGSLQYQPNDYSSFNLVVYQGITGFGGALSNSLMNLPTQFVALRDGVNGNLGSCVSTLASGACLGGAVGSVNSTAYRSRGISASYSLDWRRVRAGMGIGYDRRQYIAAAGTVLAGLNGKVDQVLWGSAFLGYRTSERSSLETTLSGYKFQSGVSSTGDLLGVRAVTLYQYFLSRRLTANASLALDGIMREDAQDVWTTAGSLGMRYSF